MHSAELVAAFNDLTNDGSMYLHYTQEPLLYVSHNGSDHMHL